MEPSTLILSQLTDIQPLHPLSSSHSLYTLRSVPYTKWTGGYYNNENGYVRQWANTSLSNYRKNANGTEHLDICGYVTAGEYWCYTICDVADIATVESPLSGGSSGPTTKPGQDEAHAVVINTTAKQFSAVEIEGKNVFYAQFTPSYNGSAIINMTKAGVAQYKTQGGSWIDLPADGKISINEDVTYLLKWEFAEAGDGEISYTLSIPGYDRQTAIVLTAGVSQSYETLSKPGATYTEIYFKIPAFTNTTNIKLEYTYSTTATESTPTVRLHEGEKTGMKAPETDGSFELKANTDYYISLTGHANGVTGTMKYTIVGGTTEKTTLTLNEADETVQTKLTIDTNLDELTIQRPVYASKWNTLCLPITIVASDQFPQVLEVSNIEEVSPNYYCVEFRKLEETEEMTAGKPYIVKPEDDLAEITFENVTIKNAYPTAKTFSCGATVNGTFNKLNDIDGNYYISNNEFVYADVPVAMKGFRFYITLPENANVRSFAIDDNIIETAVEEMKATGAKTASVTFDLSGKKVAVKKGIVIENGKKVMY